MTSPRLMVDLSAVTDNVRTLRRGSRARGLIAVVTADGLGHGADAVARAALAGGATALGVTTLAEAAALRHLGAPVLSWLDPVSADFADRATARVEVAVPSAAHLEAVERGAARTGVRRAVHLFVDTGTSRGCDPAEWLVLCARARRAERAGLVDVVGIMGHLGSADDEAGAHHRPAVERYARAVRVARGVGLTPRSRHLAATAAALRTPVAHHDTLRVGAGLLGIDPGGRAAGTLRPAGTLSAPFVQVRRVAVGEPVGDAHVAERSGWLGVLPLGHADGIGRRASGRATLRVRGRRRPVLGSVSAEQVVVDLGDDPVGVGEEAIVFGPGGRGEPTLTDWAWWGDTSAYEIVTGLSPRVRRVHLERVHTAGAARGRAA